MTTAITIFTIILVIVAMLIAAIVTAEIIRQKRMPLEQRLLLVRKKLRSNESPTGSTSVLAGHMTGVSDEMVRNLAAAEGYEWTGYSGQNRRQLNFQRKMRPVDRNGDEQTA